MNCRKRKLIIVEILSVITLVLPMLILFYINRERYLKVVNPVGLTLSAIACIIFSILMVKDKLRVSERKTIKFLIFFLFCYIFEPFLADLKIISFVAFVGVFVNGLIFEPIIKKLKNEIMVLNNAQILSKEGENINE